MQSIFDPVIGKGPSYTPTELDPGTRKLIDDSSKRALAPKEEMAQQLNQGVSEAGNQALQTNQQMQQQAAQTGQDPAMMQAIRNQFNQSAGKDIQSVINRTNSHMDLVKSQRLQQAYHYSMAQQQVELENFKGLTDAYSNAQQARGELLGSILSLGGTAGGKYLARDRKPKSTPSLFQDSMPYSDKRGATATPDMY